MTNPFQILMDDFLLEGQERVVRVEELLLQCLELSTEERQSALDEAGRELHTLKGNAGMMGLTDLQHAAHALEDSLAAVNPDDPDLQSILSLLDEFKVTIAALAQEPQGHSSGSGVADSPRSTAVMESVRAPGSVRVPFTVLDELVDVLAEMVIFRNRLEDTLAHAATTAVDRQEWEEVEEAHDALGKTLTLIQNRVTGLRMVPLQTLFGQLRRIVHDESHRTAKEVRLDTVGGDTPMDKALLEVASEALGHLVRNAICHGIETPTERARANKQIAGTVRVTALVHANEIEIDVSDDGVGIDKLALLRAAEERGLAAAASGDTFALLFQPGFSTRKEADMTSGRGIGLSAAAEAVQRVGGRIQVASKMGRGTRFRIHLPLSVSIAHALLLRVDGEQYALPMSAILETLRFSPSDGHTLNQAGIFTWRGRVLPVLDLGVVNVSAHEIRERGSVIIFEAGNKRRGLLVDDVIGIREIVVKALDSIGGNPVGISGATILGDGRVVLILDPHGLVSVNPRIERSVSVQEVQL